MSKATFVEQSSDPSPPAANRWTLFFKSNGAYIEDDLGVVSRLKALTAADENAPLDVSARKATAGTIPAFSAIHIVGYDPGNEEALVELAQANASSTMPCAGLTPTSITNTTAGVVRVFGILEGLNTTGYSAKDPLFVSATTAGALTSTHPTGPTSLIQRLGTVLNSAVTGHIFISGSQRANALPNLAQNYLWVGDASALPVEVLRTALLPNVLSAENQTLVTETATGAMVLMPSMTLTPAAGTYQVWFNGDLATQNSSQSVNYSIYVDGVEVAASVRTKTGNVRFPVSTVAPKVTVNGSQAIEVRWNVTGSTGEAYNRSLVVTEVRP